MFALTKSIKATTMWLSRSLLHSPARLSILGFAALILSGTGLLMFPECSTGKPLDLVDALFTATSASCVTGLAVVDTGTALSFSGQMVVLLLIQVGGLGIMTLSTLFLLIARRRPSLAGHIVIQDTFTHSGEKSLPSILMDVVLFTFAIEALGTVLMLVRFFPGRAFPEALYFSVFHAVSAFCNAGFSLFTESFSGYRQDWLFNLTTCFLIFCGGIGFLVLSEVNRQFTSTRPFLPRLSLHSKLVLSTTAILIVSGTLLILAMEWQNTLAPLALHDRFLAALFQSVSARTAGFNTLPIGGMANETLFVLMLLMFIGASPGSCGGGIKTTTFASLVVLGLSRLRGHMRPHLFRRTIAEASIAKAVSVVMISAVVIVAGAMALLMSELGELPHSLSRGKFMELLFEVTSAFGTVGLSMGVTPGLSAVGKIVLTCVMFVGRLGPLVIAVAVTRGAAARYYYAEEPVMIG
jgi:trk system potassium uptake protein TrkH